MMIGRHYQNAYVTRNVDKAVAAFKKQDNVRTLMTFEVPVELWTPHGSGKGTQKLAFIWIEDFNIELIEPKAGDVLAIYRNALAGDDRLVLHHVCHRVEDWDAFMGQALQSPFPVVLRGGAPGALQFAYLDTRDWLGHYTEYVWMTPDRWRQMGGR